MQRKWSRSCCWWRMHSACVESCWTLLFVEAATGSAAVERSGCCWSSAVAGDRRWMAAIMRWRGWIGGRTNFHGDWMASGLTTTEEDKFFGFFLLVGISKKQRRWSGLVCSIEKMESCLMIEWRCSSFHNFSPLPLATWVLWGFYTRN
jgi:hypothetical protein